MNFVDFVETARKICDGEYCSVRKEATMHGDEMHYWYRVWVAKASRWTVATDSPDAALKLAEELHNRPATPDGPVDDSAPIA